MKIDSELFLSEQLSEWSDAKKRYDALADVRTKSVTIGKAEYLVSFNRGRAISTNAKIDTKSIIERPCFLCEKNRPAVQKKIDLFDKYSFLVNPFPICEQHFTIVRNTHTPQRILPNLHLLFDIVDSMSDLFFFYNGPQSGASAPDHMHFQAIKKGFLPIEWQWQKLVEKQIETSNQTTLHKVNFGYPIFAIKSENTDEIIDIFNIIFEKLPQNDIEPKFNLLLWKKENEFVFIVIPRKNHRPECYFATDKEKIIVSPGSIDLSGVFVTVREHDFEKLDAQLISRILGEVCLTDNEFEEVWKNIENTI